MDFENIWKKALKHTEIVRTRVQSLMTTADTSVPYILMCESSVNVGDTVVRKGSVTITRPSLIVPPNNPQFEGFDFDGEDEIDADSLINFLLVRGVTLPSMHYDNKTISIDVFSESLAKAVKHYEKELQEKENVTTGLIIGHEDCWQLSLLIFVCTQIAKNADRDIKSLMDQYKKEG